MATVCGYMKGFEEAKEMARKMANDYYTKNPPDRNYISGCLFKEPEHEEGWHVHDYDYLVGYGPLMYCNNVYGVIGVDKFDPKKYSGKEDAKVFDDKDKWNKEPKKPKKVESESESESESD